MPINATTLCREAVPITNEAQFEQLTPHWARNFHRGAAFSVK